MKISLTLKTDLNKLFETNKKVDNIGVSNAQIAFLKEPYLQYKQIVLAKSFRQYFESILFSAKVLRMGMQKTPYLKTYDTGTQDFSVDFIAASRQFDWIKILLVFDKSDTHLTIYDSYNAESTARLIKSLEFRNVSEEHSTTNTLKYDTSNDLQKHLLCKQFVAWHTNGCLTAPLTDFTPNPIAQELKDETNYYSNDSGKKVYVDFRDSRGYTKELSKPFRNDSFRNVKADVKRTCFALTELSKL